MSDGQPWLMDGNDDSGWELVVPFTVCTSHGGPYDDAAFVAGVNLGRLWARMEDLADGAVLEMPIEAELRAQADLLAMSYGLAFSAVDLGDGWIGAQAYRPADDLGGLQGDGEGHETEPGGDETPPDERVRDPRCGADDDHEPDNDGGEAGQESDHPAD